MDGHSVKTTLRGAPDAHVLLPLDFPPSRSTEPRWGYLRPPHAGLSQLIARDEQGYRDFFPELRGVIDRLPAIFGDRQLMTHPEFNGLDVAVLVAMIERFRPSRIVEVGSGNSTAVILRTVSELQLSTQLTVIDPEPKLPADSSPHQTIRLGLEELPDLAFLSELAPGDLLFIDSTHRAFSNSDVTVFMLDVLPSLRPGVVVHLHDISLPFDYDPYFRLRYWNEQYLLAAWLLAAPERVRVLFPCLSVGKDPKFADLFDPPLLPSLHPKYSQQGWSFWFQREAARAVVE